MSLSASSTLKPTLTGVIASSSSLNLQRSVVPPSAPKVAVAATTTLNALLKCRPRHCSADVTELAGLTATALRPTIRHWHPPDIHSSWIGRWLLSQASQLLGCSASWRAKHCGVRHAAARSLEPHNPLLPFFLSLSALGPASPRPQFDDPLPPSRPSCSLTSTSAISDAVFRFSARSSFFWGLAVSFFDVPPRLPRNLLPSSSSLLKQLALHSSSPRSPGAPPQLPLPVGTDFVPFVLPSAAPSEHFFARFPAQAACTVRHCVSILLQQPSAALSCSSSTRRRASWPVRCETETVLDLAYAARSHSHRNALLHVFSVVFMHRLHHSLQFLAVNLRIVAVLSLWYSVNHAQSLSVPYFLLQLFRFLFVSWIVLLAP